MVPVLAIGFPYENVGLDPMRHPIKLNEENLIEIESMTQRLNMNKIPTENDVNVMKLSSQDTKGSLLDRKLVTMKLANRDIPTLIESIKNYEPSILDFGSISPDSQIFRSIWDMVLVPRYAPNLQKCKQTWNNIFGYQEASGNTSIGLIQILIDLNANVNICSYHINDPENTRETLLDKLLTIISEKISIAKISELEDPQIGDLQTLANKIIRENSAVTIKKLNLNEQEIYNSLISGLRTKKAPPFSTVQELQF